MGYADLNYYSWNNNDINSLGMDYPHLDRASRAELEYRKQAQALLSRHQHGLGLNIPKTIRPDNKINKKLLLL